MGIHLAIEFFTTRVLCSTDQDFSKRIGVLRYLNGTLDECCILGAGSMSVLNTWVNALYAVHGDMKSHIGGVI